MLKFIVMQPFSLGEMDFDVGTAFLSGDIACILDISEENAIKLTTELEMDGLIRRLGDYDA